MPVSWGEHLELARCVEATGELDIGAAAVAGRRTSSPPAGSAGGQLWEIQTLSVTPTTAFSSTRSCYHLTDQLEPWIGLPGVVLRLQRCAALPELIGHVFVDVPLDLLLAPLQPRHVAGFPRHQAATASSGSGCWTTTSWPG